MVVKKDDYPPPKFVVCHDNQCGAMVPVCSIYGGEIMWQGPSFECWLFWVLGAFDVLFKGIFQCVPVCDLDACVLFAEVFVRPDSKVIIVWISINFIVRAA